MLWMAGCSSGTSTVEVGGEKPTGSTQETSAIPQELQRLPKFPSRAVCGTGSGKHCFAHIRVDEHGDFARADLSPAATVSGLGATDLQAAYKIPTTGGTGTIAIVDAFDYPKAEADLKVYRAQYGLPPCTTANGCFKKVNQTGAASPLPPAATAADDWNVEAALDLDMASAGCPTCKLVLVEANSDQDNSLFIANNAAAAIGTVVSNSWGKNGETAADTATETYFTHPGVGIFFASGDAAYGASYPATSPLVFAVGGTTLTSSNTASRGWVETVWFGSSGGSNFGTGSGCSAIFAKPGYQNGVTTGCTKRAEADLSAVADNLAIYVNSASGGGWGTVGGTSAATPLTAAIFANTGHGGAGPDFVYSNKADFFDVTSGKNGTCSPSVLCTAGTGWDGPTGLGTPNAALLAGSTTAPSFSLDTNPTDITLAAGGTTTASVVTTASAGSTQTIALSASGLPSGVTAAFSPTSVTAGGSATLTLKATAAAAATTVTFSVRGVSGSETETATPTLTVTSVTPPVDGGTPPTDGGTPPTDGGTVLANGVPQPGLSGAKSSTTIYTATVPAGASNLVITIAGGTSSASDADLYVRFGTAPTTTTYDCRPYLTGSNETCTVAAPQAGTYYVMLRGYSSYSGVTLKATWSTSGGGTGGTDGGTGGGSQLSSGVPVTGISGAKTSKTYYALNVPSGSSSVTFTIVGSSSGSNDADMYVRAGAEPTTTTYDCRPYKTGSNETCTIPNPTSGAYDVMLVGFSAYSGVTLTGTVQ